MGVLQSLYSLDQFTVYGLAQVLFKHAYTLSN